MPGNFIFRMAMAERIAHNKSFYIFCSAVFLYKVEYLFTGKGFKAIGLKNYCAGI